MARYRVLVTSFIGDKLLNPTDENGNPTIIEFSGAPGENLELVDSSVKTAGVEADGGVYTDNASDLA